MHTWVSNGCLKVLHLLRLRNAWFLGEGQHVHHRTSYMYIATTSKMYARLDHRSTTVTYLADVSIGLILKDKVDWSFESKCLQDKFQDRTANYGDDCSGSPDAVRYSMIAIECKEGGECESSVQDETSRVLHVGGHDPAFVRVG